MQYFAISKFQQGAALLEALIAVALFSVGILALAGLQVMMIKNVDAAKYRAEAAFLAQQKLSDIWLNKDSKASLSAYAEQDATIAQLPGGKSTVAITGRDIQVIINWTMPGGTERTYLANARVEGRN